MRLVGEVEDDLDGFRRVPRRRVGERAVRVVAVHALIRVVGGAALPPSPSVLGPEIGLCEPQIDDRLPQELGDGPKEHRMEGEGVHGVAGGREREPSVAPEVGDRLGFRRSRRRESTPSTSRSASRPMRWRGSWKMRGG